MGYLLGFILLAGVAYFFIRTGESPIKAVKSIFKRGGGGGNQQH